MSQYADFIAQIESLPELVRTEARPIDDRMRLLLKTPEIYGIRQVVLVGSGDSYFAAQAVVPAIRAWTGLPVVAMLAMEAARYVDAGVTPLGGQTRGLLVVAISNSGEAARVVEATQRLRTLGALTLGITAAPDSRLGRSAERVLDITVPGLGSAPGTRSYVAAMLAAYSVGLRLAEVRLAMTMDAVNALRGEIAGMSDALAAAVQVAAAPIRDVVASWRGFSCVDVLGSGPALASAGYAAAKLVEAAGLHATAQDAEEFHHLNYFVADPDHVPAVAFATGASRAASRMRELVGTLEGLGRPALIVTDHAELPAYGVQIRLPAVREWFAPLLHAVPAAYLAAAWAEAIGAPHYRGHTGRWRHSQGANLVRNSPLEV